MMLYPLNDSCPSCGEVHPAGECQAWTAEDEAAARADEARDDLAA